MMFRTYIVIVNWNGWADTLECIESLLHSNPDSPFHIVICDNGSTDDSLNNIEAWFKGDLNLLKNSSSPIYDDIKGLQKPISYSLFNKDSDAFISEPNTQCSLIGIGENLGFAGGCNVGIEFSLKQADCKYVWLLNNDTVVTKDALSNLIAEAETSRDIGVCGSTLLYYDCPDVIQALGGAKYYHCLSMSHHVGAHENINDVDLDKVSVEKMSYIIGASFLVKKEVFHSVGLLSEEYFLYCEEVDFCERIKEKFKLAYAPRSIVYHKEGASIGGSRLNKKVSDVSLYYSVKSKLKVARKSHKICLPLVVVITISRMLLLFLLNKRKESIAIFSALSGKDFRS